MVGSVMEESWNPGGRPANRAQGQAPPSDFGKLSRLRKNSAHTGNVDEKSQNAADATIAQDAQNGRPRRVGLAGLIWFVLFIWFIW